jgi:hypothetical protein
MAFVEEGFEMINVVAFKVGFLDDHFFSLPLDLLNTTSGNTGLVSYKQLQQRIGHRIIHRPDEKWFFGSGRGLQ